ncbi:hypothetical protein [Streptomyces sp. NPDC048825]|uniref:hypothetical protein n=1 Tax=Streptomyces sp. NPDC048825 TaxID=3365592 RepID=UPI003718E7B1
MTLEEIVAGYRELRSMDYSPEFIRRALELVRAERELSPAVNLVRAPYRQTVAA